MSDIEIHAVIMAYLLGTRRRAVVSTNRLMAMIREQHPRCSASDRELASSIKAIAISLGLTPVTF